MALTIMVMAGSALVLATSAAMESATDAVDATIAQGIARQFLDEALGLPYAEPGSDPYAPTLGPEPGEDAAAGRFLAWDDTDDCAHYRAAPLVDPWGQPWGVGDDQGGARDPGFQLRSDYFRHWTLTAEVVYVAEDDPSRVLGAGEMSGLRAIEVAVSKHQAPAPPRVLATMRRVYSHVPAPR